HILSYLLFRYLPPLHSFPTRRSSDLFHPFALRLRTWGQEHGPSQIALRIGPDDRGIHRRKAVAKGRNDPSAYTHQAGEYNLLIVDRKSTRLNSSHVKISYAVFCLKKK